MGVGGVVAGCRLLGLLAGEVASGIVRLEADHLAEVGERVVVVLLDQVGEPAIAVRQSVLRVEPDGRVEVRDGVVVLALGLFRLPAEEKVVGVVRLIRPASRLGT